MLCVNPQGKSSCAALEESTASMGRVLCTRWEGRPLLCPSDEDTSRGRATPSWWEGLLEGRLAHLVLMVLLSAGALTFTSGRAEAARMTRSQSRLSERAVREVRRRKYQRAAELLRRALEEGSIDLLWLNLGRALFRSNDCAGAAEAYAQARSAPALRGIGSTVRQKLAQYQEDIERECAATVVLNCEFPETEFSFDGAESFVCGRTKRLQLPAGRHTLRWGLGGASQQERSLELRGGALYEEQLPAPVEELIESARQAIEANQLARAEQLLRFFEGRSSPPGASVLSGRIAFLQERCEDAVSAFTAAAEGPLSPPLADALTQWRAESLRLCPGQLQLRCEPEDIWIQLGERDLQPCPHSPIDLPPGEWSLRAFYERERLEERLVIEPLSRSERVLSLESGSDPYLLWGWISGAVGVAALGSVLAIDQLKLAPEYERYEGYAREGRREAYTASQNFLSQMRLVNLSLLVTGALSLATSGTLFVLRPKSFTPPN